MDKRLYPVPVAIVLATAFCMSSARADAAVTHLQSVAAVRAQHPPSQDLQLQDPVWSSALKASGFENFTARTPARYRTTAYFLYDDRYLYVAVSSEQAGTPLTAVQTLDHAGVMNDDQVSLVIDPSGNGSRIYTFNVNPRGVHDETSSENSRYAPLWHSSARVFANGDWNALMVIPLSDLRAQDAGGDWKINFSRFIAATGDTYTWAYEETQAAVLQPQVFPRLTGMHVRAGAARPKPRSDLYLLSSAGERQINRHIGVDAAYPVTNTISLVGTLNPDFSNVEQDQTKIAPQEFQRYYSEYRPFFAQGARYINAIPQFQLGNAAIDTLFYTPKLGEFNRGLKLEGTSGKNAFGILNAEGADFDDTAFGYARREFDGNLAFSAEGVIANHSGLRDRSFGVGWQTYNPRSGAFSSAKYASENGSLTAGAQPYWFSVSGGIQGARGVVAFAYQDIAPRFNPLDGFTQLDDMRGLFGTLIYNGVFNGGALKSYQLQIFADRYVDRSGAPRNVDMEYNAQVWFRNLLSLNLTNWQNTLRLYDEPYPVYSGASNVAFNQPSIQIGYKDGTPTPTDASYTWGEFGGAFLQQISFSTAHNLGPYSVGAELDGTVEHGRPLFAPPDQPGFDTQWLRRISITRSFGGDASLAFGVRSISGRGGFALPGTNIVASFHKLFRNQDELFLDFGSPTAHATLHRVIFKYVFHAGGSSGT
jgi:hypothetical protein